jgi:hypothetical protein
MRNRFTRPLADGDVTAGQTRRAIASYSSYRRAERAVDRLADSGFPIERVSIVGRGLQFVEQVTGRIGYLEAALRGALAGSVAGVLIGWLFDVFDWFDPIVDSAWLAIDGLWFGALAGAAIGLVQHALLRGHRDFASIGALQAERYEVQVDDEVADEAERISRPRPQSPAAG